MGRDISPLLHTYTWRVGDNEKTRLTCLGSQDLVRLGLLYENPQDHDRHNGDSQSEDNLTPTFRTRSPSSDKHTHPTGMPEADGGFSSLEEEWDVMSSTGSETNQSEAWEIVGDGM